MPDYQKGKIYTIRCKTDDTLIYVGSTTQSLARRWGKHKNYSNTEINKNRLIYTTINNNWDNWYIELYELYPCSCKIELCRKEGEIIRLIGSLNKEIAGRTQQEWNADNKDKRTKWNEDNKDKMKELKKQNYEKNKEKRKEQKKQNYEKNKEKYTEYQKEYREANKEKIAKKAKEKYEKKKQEKNNIIII